MKLFPSDVEPPAEDADVAQVLLQKVRLERTRQLGPCYLGWQMWQRLKRDEFFQEVIDTDGADVPWSQVAAILAINRLCTPQRIGAGAAMVSGYRFGRYLADWRRQGQ